MPKKVIHVNRHFIAFNRKIGADVLPVYTVKEGSKNTYGFAVKVRGASELVDPRRHNALSCGARAWIETDGEIEIVDPMTWAEVQVLKSRYDGDIRE